MPIDTIALMDEAIARVQAQARQDFASEVAFLRQEHGRRYEHYLNLDPREAYGRSDVRVMYRDALTQPMEEFLPVDDEAGNIGILEEAYVEAWGDEYVSHLNDSRY